MKNRNKLYSIALVSISLIPFLIFASYTASAATTQNDSSVAIPPVADFSITVNRGYYPLFVQFTDLSENATAVSWNFGDGSTSTEQNPMHTYGSAGTYTVNQTATNANGTNSRLETITVLEPPTIVYPDINDYNYLLDPIALERIENPLQASFLSREVGPLSVAFDDVSSYGPQGASYYWNFGDGTTSTQQNPVHTYSSVGYYTVTLTLSGFYTQGSASLAISVTNSSPVANFNVFPVSGTAPLKVTFSDESTELPLFWYWDFGDGAISTQQNPIHIYSSAGTYNVNLTATNGKGADSKSATIIVSELTVLPAANFSSSVTSGYAPLSVQFTHLSRNVTAWNWNFGDGTNSTQQSPIHTYSSTGTYTVNQTATNANGTNSRLATIRVLERPAAVLPVANFCSINGYSPLSVKFKDLSENATAVSWDFGDGATSTERNPEHTFSAARNYTVKLTVTNANGTDSKLVTINILQPKVPDVHVNGNGTNISPRLPCKSITSHKIKPKQPGTLNRSHKILKNKGFKR